MEVDDAAPQQEVSTDQVNDKPKTLLPSIIDLKPTRVLMAAFLLVATVTSIGFTASTLAVMLKTDYLTPDEASHRMCVPCNTLMVTNDPIDDVSSGFEKEGDICCSRNSTQTQLIITTVSDIPCFIHYFRIDTTSISLY